MSSQKQPKRSKWKSGKRKGEVSMANVKSPLVANVSPHLDCLNVDGSRSFTNVGLPEKHSWVPW